VYACLKSQKERIEQKKTAMTTTDVVSKLDDFSHAKIHRQYTNTTIVTENDDKEARNVGTRLYGVLIFTLLLAIDHTFS